MSPPSLPLLQFDAVFTRDAIREVVEVYSERWSRGGLNARGGSGPTKFQWFEATSIEDRVEEVYRAAQGLKAGTWNWPDLLQVLAPKDVKLPEHLELFVGHFVVKSGKSRKPRRLCMADPIAQALQYVIADAIKPYVAVKLSKHAIAYRKGLPMVLAFKNAIKFARDHKLYAVAVLDIETFYDSIRWDLLDEVLDTLGVDDTIRGALKSLCRVRVLDAKGRVVFRDMGLAQGLVIAPEIANLFLAAFDVRVQQILGKWGVHLWRYADDIALFARDRESLKKAVAVVRTELGQLRLRVKDGTGTIKDMMNPENLPVWVGFMIAHDDMWADPDKLRLKLKRLLLLREQGRVDDEDLVHRLDDLQAHYERVLHESRAGEAVAFIENALMNQCPPPPRKENIDNIRRQLRTRPGEMETSTSTPNGVGGNESVPVEEVHLEGREEETRFPSDAQGRSPHGLGPCEGPPGASGSLSLLHSGHEVRLEAVPLHEGVLDVDLRVDGEVVHRVDPFSPPPSLRVAGGVDGDRPGGRAPLDPQLSSFPLARPGKRSRPPTSSDPARHPKTRAYKHNLGRRLVAAIECPWTVVVHGHAGPAEAHAPKRSPIVVPVVCPEAKSPAEVHLEGYRAVLHRLQAEGALWVVMKVTDRTLDGYITHGWKIGKPHIRRRWTDLAAVIEQMEVVGAAIWFEVQDGRLVCAGRHQPYEQGALGIS